MALPSQGRLSPNLAPTHKDLLGQAYFWPPGIALHLAYKEAEIGEFHQT